MIGLPHPSLKYHKSPHGQGFVRALHLSSNLNLESILQFLSWATSPTWTCFWRHFGPWSKCLCLSGTWTSSQRRFAGACRGCPGRVSQQWLFTVLSHLSHRPQTRSHRSFSAKLLWFYRKVVTFTFQIWVSSGIGQEEQTGFRTWYCTSSEVWKYCLRWSHRTFTWFCWTCWCQPLAHWVRTSTTTGLSSIVERRPTLEKSRGTFLSFSWLGFQFNSQSRSYYPMFFTRSELHRWDQAWSRLPRSNRKGLSHSSWWHVFFQNPASPLWWSFFVSCQICHQQLSKIGWQASFAHYTGSCFETYSRS